MKQSFVLHAALLLAGLPAAAAEKPNILLIYADDIGYGDVGCYGATAVKTPNVDRLAKEGLRFTSGYCAASTCTPSRYAMITGEYAFRKKGTGILPGNAAMIIPTERATLPSIMQQAGYTTGIVGKWHLGLGLGGDLIDWNGELKPGPRETGFGYSFIMAATGDRAPCVYIENQRIVGLDPSDPIQVSYGKPFPGEPTGISERDHLKMDWSYDHNNTLVILTSDNGPVLNDGYKDGAAGKIGSHQPAGPLRGGKGTLWEGGTRIPFVVRWPARVKPGVSDALASQVDFCASFAALTGQALSPNDTPDSFNVLPALLGESPHGREHVLEHSNKVAIRDGQWKFIPATAQDAKASTAKRGPKGGAALYDLTQDPAEATNVAGQHPDVVEKLSKELDQLHERGRSRP